MKHQRGAALLVILMIVGVLGAFVAVRALNGLTAERDKVTAAALAQAKDALIGYAVTYRDTHPTELNGYLPLPDLGSTRNTTPGEGQTAGNFTGNTSNLSAVGRIPWQHLGLPALRDSSGECLWYAVSGSYQNAQKAKFMNWDTLGQFDTFTSDATAIGTVSTVGANPHQRPVALVIAPGAVMAGQTRAPGADLVTECGGNYDARNYLDTFTTNPALNNIVNYLTGTNNTTGSFLFAAPKQLLSGPVVQSPSRDPLVNDRMLTITADQLFRVIGRRSDFSGFVNSQLLATAATNLAGLAPPVTLNFTAAIPTETSGGSSIGALEIGRVPSTALTSTSLKMWQDNLLYARCASGTGCLTVNGLSCTGIVIFAGQRTGAQMRASNAQKNAWSNYLEGSGPGGVLTAFTTGTTTFTGPTAYSTTSPSTDVMACVKPTPGATQASFAANLGSFTTVGNGVTRDLVAETVTIADAAGSAGGCLWSPTRIPLAGKVLRAYYEFQFAQADTFALTGLGADRGNGFSISLVHGDIPVVPATFPATYKSPNTCGTEAAMGVLSATDAWGSDSVIVATDVRHDAGQNDPVENHTALMLNGNIGHTGPGDTMSAACDASAAGCRHTPANLFEESPLPAQHNQRIEIHTGCNAGCTVCNPASHVAPNIFARITTWVNCKDCTDVATDLNRSVQVPSVQRCVSMGAPMYPTGSMDNVFFGFTGGFRSGASQQGVTLKNLVLRSE